MPCLSHAYLWVTEYLLVCIICRIAKEEVECKEIADDAEADLAIALPALNQALEEVDKLDKSSIRYVTAAGFVHAIFYTASRPYSEYHLAVGWLHDELMRTVSRCTCTLYAS